MKKIIVVIFSIIICSTGEIAIGEDFVPEEITNEQVIKTLESRDRRDKKIKELSKKIQTEIQALTNHDWAGEYFLGNGLSGIQLLLAPESGYVLERNSDIGPLGCNFGIVSEKNGRICLSNNKIQTRQMFPGNAEEFIPIKWGTRKYLIPADELVGFCNDINEGAEPRKWNTGQYFLRRGDAKKKVTGFPVVPKGFRTYLLERPIEAQIVAVDSPAPRARDCEDWKYPVTLNVGKNHGLLPGMKLYLLNPDRFVGPVIIKNVENMESEGIISQSGRKNTAPVIGSKLSTHSSRWDRK